MIGNSPASVATKSMVTVCPRSTGLLTLNLRIATPCGLRDAGQESKRDAGAETRVSQGFAGRCRGMTSGGLTCGVSGYRGRKAGRRRSVDAVLGHVVRQRALADAHQLRGILLDAA